MPADTAPLTLRDPNYYVWSFPGSPIKVQLDLKLMERLQKRFAQSLAAEEQGILWGEVFENTTEIRNLQVLSEAEIPCIRQILLDANDTAGLPVGYYRLAHEREGLRLNQRDYAVMEALFHNPQQVFFIVQPASSGPANATFFFWDDGRICGDFPFLEFPLDPSLVAAAGPRKAAPTPTPQVTAAPAPVALPPPAAVPQKGSFPSYRMMLAALVLVGLPLLIWRLFPEALSQVRARLASLKMPAPGASPAPEPPPQTQPSLGLEAERQHGDLKVTWNRASLAIRNATSGTVTIQDGSLTRQLHLDAGLVREGSLLYSPVNEQIQLQLSVDGESAATETVIVIVPKNGQAAVRTVANPAPREAAATPKPFTPPPSRGPESSSLSPPLVNEPPALSPASSMAAEPLLLPVLATLQNPGQPAAPPVPGSARLQPDAATAPPPRISDLQPARAVRQVVPDVPSPARGTLAATVVQVRIAIDESGKVTKASLVPGQNAPGILVRAALDAARRWQFQPARLNGQPIASDMLLNFDFKPGPR